MVRIGAVVLSWMILWGLLAGVPAQAQQSDDPAERLLEEIDRKIEKFKNRLLREIEERIARARGQEERREGYRRECERTREEDESMEQLLERVVEECCPGEGEREHPRILRLLDEDGKRLVLRVLREGEEEMREVLEGEPEGGRLELKVKPRILRVLEEEGAPRAYRLLLGDEEECLEEEEESCPGGGKARIKIIIEGPDGRRHEWEREFSFGEHWDRIPDLEELEEEFEFVPGEWREFLKERFPRLDDLRERFRPRNWERMPEEWDWKFEFAEPEEWQEKLPERFEFRLPDREHLRELWQQVPQRLRRFREQWNVPGEGRDRLQELWEQVAEDLRQQWRPYRRAPEQDEDRPRSQPVRDRLREQEDRARELLKKLDRRLEKIEEAIEELREELGLDR